MTRLARKSAFGIILAWTWFSAALAFAQASSDPVLSWRTLRTAHFEIHYHEPLGIQARRVAAIAEHAYETYARVLRAAPTQVTQIVLTDDTDSANGSATALPYNTIRLYSTAPEDLSPLNEYDDWMTALVDHEHTHVAQLDSIRGIPAIVNRIFGKVFAPHHGAPRWLLEGLAVYEETEQTSGGRLRSTMWDMFLRADAYEGRFIRLDQMSNAIDRWPHGNAWYLYGSQFVNYVGRTYGHQVFADLVYDGAGQLVLPLALNALPRNTNGHSIGQLYDAFLDDAEQRYATQIQAVLDAGRIEGARITFHGEEARTPRFLSNNELVYWAADNRTLSELRILDLNDEARITTRVQAIGDGSPCPAPGGMVFSALGMTRDLYAFNDLYRYDREQDHVERLTHGLRAAEPDVSPDGMQVVFTINGAGTRHLAIAPLNDAQGGHRMLVQSARYEQVYTPRFSPNGRTVAASFWREGGYRDVGLVDVATGEVRFLMHDRALDTGPAWSPDGNTLYFASDRTGISNIYAYSMITGALQQVTNVIMGAYMPAVSPDGQRIAYVGYTTYGWDIHVLDLNPRAFRNAPEFTTDQREGASNARTTYVAASEPYSPWPSILPRSYSLGLVQDAFGYQLQIGVAGADVVGKHNYHVRVGAGLTRGDPTFDASYEYAGLPLRLSAHMFRTVNPRGGLELGGVGRTWIENLVGGDVSASYSFRRLYYSNSLRLTYAISNSREQEPIVIPIDPNDPPPRLPQRGYFGQLRLGWSYSSVRRFAYDISPSDGAALSANATWIDPLLGAPFRAATFSWSAQTYVLMPWLSQHVLAMRYGGGYAFDEKGPRSAFSLGGFPQVNLVEALVQLSYIGGVALRGFAPGFQSGAQYHLAQFEYRFPIWRPQWGVGLFPLYINRLYGTVFVDTGEAFGNVPSLSRWAVGTGAELFADLTFLYYTGITLRIGFARGVTEGGQNQFYVHLGTGF